MNELQPPDSVVNLLEQLASRDLRPSRPLLETIQTWDRLVDEIGNYPGSIADEYLNDLGSRTLISLWLAIAVDEGMTALLEWVLPIIDEIDDRYRNKSHPDQERLNWGFDLLNPNYWWLRRLPNDEGLLNHFRAVGPSMRSVTTSHFARDV